MAADPAKAPPVDVAENGFMEDLLLWTRRLACTPLAGGATTVVALDLLRFTVSGEDLRMNRDEVASETETSRNLALGSVAAGLGASRGLRSVADCATVDVEALVEVVRASGGSDKGPSRKLLTVRYCPFARRFGRKGG